MPAIPERLAQLDTLSLDNGSHARFDAGHCALEVAAYIAGEPHSDEPACVCPVIRRFLVSWNDSLPDNATRDRLIKPLLPAILDTRASPAVMLRRSLLCIDWAVREWTPTWLELAKLTEPAAELRALAPIDTWEAFDACAPLDRARQVAAAARDAGDAAWAAARDAARAAAWDAAWAAARDAAWAAAWAAARAAAWDAAWAAAWAAARDAARDAAWAAAWAAARDAGDAAWAAARAAAWAHMAPTVERLQASAVALVERMVAVVEP